MVVSYGYQWQENPNGSGRKWVGYYQCEDEEFKKLWSKLDKKKVTICYVYRGEKCYRWMRFKKIWEEI